MSAAGGARSVEHHHASDTARSRAEHLLRTMAQGKAAVFRASNRRPLPIKSSTRSPDSRRLAVRSEVSQGIARRAAGNFSVDQKEKSARRFYLRQQRFSP